MPRATRLLKFRRGSKLAFWRPPRALRVGRSSSARPVLQETPHGDFVILTFEGDNPAESFAKIMSETGPEFAAFAKEVHGLDMSVAPAMPTLVFDSRG